MSSKLVGKIILDQFRVDAFLDAGGMGSVFKVWDLKRNVPLAMKVLHTDLAEDPTMFKRFKREARALQKLAHPNIVPFYGLYQTDDFSFMLERFIDGPTLKDILKKKQGNTCSEKEAVIYLKAICSALGYAHTNGVIHCDVKSANIMVDRGGSIYLSDFGIARHSDSSTTTMAGAGTPAYMAPEQILSKPVSAATDVYALGVLLFEMLAGQRPFKGTEKETQSAGPTVNERIRYAQLNLPAPDPRSFNPSINPKLVEVMLKALEKDPEARYQSCQAFLDSVCKSLGLNPDLIPDRVDISNNSIPSMPPEIPQFPSDGGRTPDAPAFPAGSTKAANRKNVWVFFAIGGVALMVVIFALSGTGGHPPLTSNATSLQLAKAIPSSTLSKDNSEAAIPTSTPRRAEPTSTHLPLKISIPSPTQPSSTKGSCPGAEPQRVQKGDRVMVCTKSDRVIVRFDPEPGDNEYFRIYPGTEVKIIDGPRCADDSSWWLVQVPTGIKVFKGSNYILSQVSEGWIREGSDAKDRYYICRID